MSVCVCVCVRERERERERERDSVCVCGGGGGVRESMWKSERIYFLRIQKLRDFLSTVFLSKNLLNKPLQRLSSTTHSHVEVSLVDPEQILHGSHACEDVADRNSRVT